jgi:hypothetical protein
VLFDVLQMGVVPEQSAEFAPEHSAQAPLARQAGAAAEGQARVALEPLSPLHPAQEPVDISHLGVVLVHSAVLVAEHCAQAPDPRQAGRAADGQARVALEPLSPSQPTHAPLSVSQTGALAGQLALDEQLQRCVVVLQLEPGLVQAVELVAEH